MRRKGKERQIVSSSSRTFRVANLWPPLSLSTMATKGDQRQRKQTQWKATFQCINLKPQGMSASKADYLPCIETIYFIRFFLSFTTQGFAPAPLLFYLYHWRTFFFRFYFLFFFILLYFFVGVPNGSR